MEHLKLARYSGLLIIRPLYTPYVVYTFFAQSDSVIRSNDVLY